MDLRVEIRPHPDVKHPRIDHPAELYGISILHAGLVARVVVAVRDGGRHPAAGLQHRRVELGMPVVKQI